jgi:hypothetical protein
MLSRDRSGGVQVLEKIRIKLTTKALLTGETGDFGSLLPGIRLEL